MNILRSPGPISPVDGADTAGISSEVTSAGGIDLGDVPEEIFHCLGEVVRPRGEAGPVDERALCGSWIGRYQVLEVLGSGAFGVVYRAEQLQPIHREVALKVIRTSVESHEVIERFEEERQTLARMQHPSIIAVLDAGTTDGGSPYFVMERVEGQPVTRYCDQRKLSITERVALFQQICLAVPYAHQKAVLHRDLKPSNILITEIDGQPVPKIIDFGMAQAMAPASGEKQPGEGDRPAFIGTPPYVSPEQTAGSLDLDIRSDIYALGAVLYVLLAGIKPAASEMMSPSSSRQQGEAPQPALTDRPSLALMSLAAGREGSSAAAVAAARCTSLGRLLRRLQDDLDWVVLRAMARERESRYPSAQSLADDLDRWRQRQPVQARPGNAVYRTRKFFGRHAVSVIAVVSLIVVMALGAVVSLMQARQADLARRQPEAALVETQAQERLAELAKAQAITSQGVAESALNRVNGLLERSWLETGRSWLERSRIFKTNGQPHAALLSAARAVGFAVLGRQITEPAHVEETFPPLLGRRFETDSALEKERQNLALDVDRLIDSVRPSLWPLWSRQHPQLPLGSVHRLSLHPDGSMLAVVHDDGQLRFWDCGTNREALDPVLGYPAALRDVAFSGDGSLLAAGSVDGALVLWNWRDRRQRCLRAREAVSVHRLAVSPDGTLVLAAYAEQTVRLWNTQTGQPVWSAPQSVVAPVADLTFSTNGNKLALALQNGSMTVWSLQDNQTDPKVFHFQSPEGLMSIAFDPTGAMLVLGGAHGSVKLFDLAQERYRNGFQAQHQNSIGGVVFSGDGLRIFSGDWNGLVRTWSVETGQAIGPPVRYESRIQTMAATADGQGWVAGTRHAVVHLHDGQPETVPRRLTFQNAGFSAVALSPDGTQLVASTRAYAIEVWNTTTGKLRLSLTGHVGRLSDLVFSPDGTLLASASWDGSVRLWETTGWTEVAVLDSHEDSLNDVDFSANGSQLVTAGSSGRLAFWDVATRERTGLFPVSPAGVTVVAFQPPGDPLMVVTQEGRLLVRRLADGPWQPLVDDPEFRVTDAAFSSDGTYLAAATPSGAIRVWNARSFELQQSMESDILLNRLRFAPKGGALVAGATDGHIRWWKKTDSGEFQQAAFITAHSDVVSGIATSTDGRLLATVSLDGAMRLWDASSGSEAFTTEILDGRPRALTWSPDGRWLASPLKGHDGSGSLVLWDGTTGKLLARLTGHAKAAKSIAFSPDGQWCATGAEDGSLIVWNAKNGVRVRSMDHAGHPVTSVTFSRDSSMLASGAGDGTVRIWELAADSSTPKHMWRHPVLVSSVVFDRDHRSVITGAIDGQIIRWKLNATSAGQLLARVDSSISVLQLSPDGSLLASLTDAGQVRIMDAATFEPRCVLSTVQLEDACFAFSPDGRFIALRDNDYGVKVCEIATGATMGRLWGHTDLVSGLAFSPDGATLAVSSWSGRVKVWNTSDLSLAVSGPGPAGQAVPAAVPAVDRQSAGYDRVNHRGEPTLWSLPPTADLLSFFRAGAAKESAGTLQWLPQPEDAVPRDDPPHGLPTAEWRLLGDSTVSPLKVFSFKMKVLARGDQWQAAMALWKQFHAAHQGTEVPDEVRSTYLTLLLTTQRAQGSKLDPATRSQLAEAIDAATPAQGLLPFPPEWLRSTPAE